ncbi:hypothetical protein VNO80_35110 [Phaseolus coccineus]|uniref:Uncharacterized protein n=1 Tax=Phaseolus coccineus TaxID=3886 RepID=A0AAN9KVA2_PHACN
MRAQTSLPVLTRFQPVSSAFLLPNTAREDGFDGEATGMSRCLPSGAHVCPQSETHTHDESHIFLPECIRDWVLGWCCVCMAKSSPDRTRPEFQPVSPVWFFNSPRSSRRIMTRRWLKENPRNEIVPSL